MAYQRDTHSRGKLQGFRHRLDIQVPPLKKAVSCGACTTFLNPQALPVRYRLEYALYRLFAALMRALPLETASYVSGAIWRWGAPFTRRHRRALEQIAIAYPNLTSEERAILAAQMWETMGRVFAESFRLEEIMASDRVTIENHEAVAARLQSCNGFIACSAHQGNWEVAAIGLAQLGIPAAGIYRHLKNPLVDALLLEQRAPLYPNGLFPKVRSTALIATRYVKSGGALAVMADLRELTGLKVPFFGRPAASNPFPAMLAVTLDKPVFVAHVMREPGVRFHIRLEEVTVSRTGQREDDILATTADIQAIIEKNIRARPGEWMWSHRRWSL